MEKVRLAVLGMNQGSKIARDAVKHPEVDLVAVAGFGEKDKQIAQELGVPIYSDYTLLLKQETLDAVAIALPNRMHVEATERAVAAGVKHVLLEKPIADTVEGAEYVIDLCKKANVTLLIGHHRRSSSKYLFLREIIESGRIGDIVGLQDNFAIAKDRDYFDQTWRVVQGGGPLLFNGVHDVDDLNFITGVKPTRVFAVAKNAIRGNEVEDSVSAVIDYEGGISATYFLSDGTPGPWSYDMAAAESTFWDTYPGENSLRVFGTKGSFGFPNMDLYYYDDDAYGWTSPLKHEHFEIENNDPMTAELEHFIDLCTGRETVPRCSGEDGLNTLKVVLAMSESAKSGQVIQL